MANKKVTQLPVNTSPSSDDLLMMVNDPGGTPESQQVTYANATKGLSVMVGDSGSGGAKGLVPAQTTGDATKFLCGDATFRSVAPADATYIVQTASSGLSAEQAMGSLATGLVKNTTTTGIQSIASAGTDYVAPGAVTTSGLTQATNKLLGRTTASTGAIEEIAVGGGLSLSAGTLTGTGGGSTVPTTSQGDTLYASAANTLTALAKDTNATRYLSNTGSSNNPAWAQVALSTGISGFGTGVATALGVNVGSAGAVVTFNGALGTPSSGTLSSCTGLPISTGVSGLGTNVATFLGTPSSANLAAALTDETGTGAAVFATGPVITSPQVSLTAAHGSDDTYTGTTIIGLNNSGGVTQWDTVYLNSSSQWVLADANGSGTYPARGLAVATVSTGNATTVLVNGTVRNDAWNWTPGGTIYLSGTAGGLTQTAPSASGDNVQQVGFALTADIAYFDFNTTYLTVT